MGISSFFKKVNEVILLTSVKNGKGKGQKNKREGKSQA